VAEQEATRAGGGSRSSLVVDRLPVAYGSMAYEMGNSKPAVEWLPASTTPRERGRTKRTC
jgi:hypothetical protein